MTEWDDTDLLMAMSGWFAVGMVVGVIIGLLIAYWAAMREAKDTICPHCHRRVFPL